VTQTLSGLSGRLSLNAQKLNFSIVVVALMLFGCDKSLEQRGTMFPYTEAVLNPGATITVGHPNGSVQIHANDFASRIISGDSWEKELELIPRDSRWNGSLGLYDPASSKSPDGRLIFEEGRQFFSSEPEAMRFLESRNAKKKTIYSSSGLTVEYEVVQVPGGVVRSVAVWQLYTLASTRRREVE